LPCPPRIYRITGVSPRRHAALRDFAGALRIEEASAFVPIEYLALSPQCGFSSTVEGNLLTEQDQMAKLALVVETAQDIWG
jgi:hypothetical protein